MFTLHLTHDDMDGAGCVIFTKKIFPKHYKYQTLNYIDIEQKITNLIHYNIKNHKFINLVITDLSLSTKFLQKILKNDQISNFLYVDHHDRNDGRNGLESLAHFHDNFKFIWNKTYCATNLMYKCAISFDKNIKTKLNDKLCRLINIYDTWKKNDRRFILAQGLNEICYGLGFDEFCKKMKDGLVVDENMKEIAIFKHQEKINYFKNNKKYITEIVDKNRKILVSFAPKGEYINEYTLFFEADVYILFRYQARNYTVFSLRSNSVDVNKIANSVSKKTGNLNSGGHKFAAGLTVDSDIDYEEIISMIIDEL